MQWSIDEKAVEPSWRQCRPSGKLKINRRTDGRESRRMDHRADYALDPRFARMTQER